MNKFTYVSFHKVECEQPSGEVGSFVANLLQYMCAKNCQNTMWFEKVIAKITRGQSNLTKSASQGAYSPVRGHPRGSKVVPLNSWGRVSY